MSDVYICLGDMIGPGCGAILTDLERHYYSHACSKCVMESHERLTKWRSQGAPDPELDALFAGPKETLQ